MSHDATGLKPASSPGCGRPLLYVLLHVVLCPLLCGLATWFLIERDAGEAKGWAFVLLTSGSGALSFLSAFSYSSFRRSARKGRHLLLTIALFSMAPLLVFGSWILLSWAALGFPK